MLLYHQTPPLIKKIKKMKMQQTSDFNLIYYLKELYAHVIVWYAVKQL